MTKPPATESVGAEIALRPHLDGPIRPIEREKPGRFASVVGLSTALHVTSLLFVLIAIGPRQFAAATQEPDAIAVELVAAEDIGAKQDTPAPAGLPDPLASDPAEQLDPAIAEHQDQAPRPVQMSGETTENQQSVALEQNDQKAPAAPANEDPTAASSLEKDNQELEQSSNTATAKPENMPSAAQARIPVETIEPSPSRSVAGDGPGMASLKTTKPVSRTKVAATAMAKTSRKTKTEAPPDAGRQRGAPKSATGQGPAAPKGAQGKGSSGEQPDRIGGPKSSAVSAYPGKVRARVQGAAGRSGVGVTGKVVIGLTIAANGSASDIRLVRTSGNPVLDRIALSAVRRASPFPPIPQEAGRARWEFAVPVLFGAR